MNKETQILGHVSVHAEIGATGHEFVQIVIPPAVRVPVNIADILVPYLSPETHVQAGVAVLIHLHRPGQGGHEHQAHY